MYYSIIFLFVIPFILFLFISPFIMWFKVRSLEHTNKEILKILEGLNQSTTSPSTTKDIDDSTSTKYTENNISKSTAPKSPNPSITPNNSIQPKKTIQPKPVTSAKRKLADSSKHIFSVEFIINKLGILLLLIGIGFIFKLAYDNGFITEGLTVIIGALIGGLLILLASLVRNKKRLTLSQVLFGGGIATLYITTYVAYQGYNLIPGILAFVFMIGITIISFFIAVLIDSVSMSVVGILGGLLTPFILQLEQLDLFGMGLYITLLAIAAMIIYAFKKWRILQLSSVIGTVLVTIYFTSLNNMSISEINQLVFLLVLLLVIFNGTDYLLQYINYASIHFKSISLALFVTLPLVTLFQIYTILDISDILWAISFAFTALVYLVLTYIFYKKFGHIFITDITLSFIGVFFLFALFTYLGGNILVLAILVLAILFYLIAHRIEGLLIWLLGHIILSIGIISAFIQLIETSIDQTFTIGNFLIGTGIFLALLVSALLNKGIAKTIMNILAIEIYLLSLLIIYIYDLALFDEPFACIIVFYGIFIASLYLLNKKWSILPSLSILIVGILPFVIKLFHVIALIYLLEMNTPNTVAFIVYGIILYLLAQFSLNSIKPVFRILIKLNVYILISLTLLADLTVATDYFVYGLLLFGCLIVLLNKYEPDRNSSIFLIYSTINNYLWITLFIINLMLFDKYNNFLALPILTSLSLLILLIPLFYFLKNNPLTKNLLIRTILNSLAYMITIYNLFINWSFGDGTITLLWATYALVLLTYNVIKLNKTLVNFSLGMIIIVTTKFILIDLSTVSTLWKIIVSMAFGAALLILSYLLQPILSKSKEE